MAKKKLSPRFRFAKIKQSLMAEITAKNNSNSNIALSLALGAFLACSPAWGFQTLLAISLAVLFRLNKALVLLTVNISSIPPLIPLIFFAAYQSGSIILHGKLESKVPQIESFQDLGNHLALFVLGSILFATLVGFLFYTISYLLLVRFRK